MALFRKSAPAQPDKLQIALDEITADERRTAPRSSIEDACFIKTISASQVTSISDEFKTGSTVNVSATGMQVNLDFEVLVGAEVAIWVVDESEQHRVLVDGIVRWTMNRGEFQGYTAGIELTDESAEAMKQWMEQHHAH